MTYCTFKQKTKEYKYNGKYYTSEEFDELIAKKKEQARQDFIKYVSSDTQTDDLGKPAKGCSYWSSCGFACFYDNEEDYDKDSAKWKESCRIKRNTYNFSDYEVLTTPNTEMSCFYVSFKSPEEELKNIEEFKKLTGIDNSHYVYGRKS